MVSREVNVNRPEHSWIPFYRELAEKLANEGWRRKQGELVGVFKEMKDQGTPMPSFVDRLIRDIDPFTVFTPFSRRITFESTLAVMREYKIRFGIESDLPDEAPYVPYANNQSLGYFSAYEGMESDIDLLWQMFQIVLNSNPFDQGFDREQFIETFDKCLSIKMIAVSKLTSAFYWINPHHFLHTDTVNEITQRDHAPIRIEDGETYLECLLRAREFTSRSFPESNILAYKSSNTASEPADVWIVRGGARGQSIDYQLQNRIAGIGFNLTDVDVSGLNDRSAIREAYASRNPNAGEGRVRANVGSVSNFVRDMKICDYVLMPHGDQIYYGKVVSDPYYVPNGPWENRRDIEWGDSVVDRSDLPSLPVRTRTVTQATDNLEAEFFAWIESNSLPDDESDDEFDGESEDARAFGIAEMLNDDLFFEATEWDRILGRFQDKKNLILQGPPGVGKTFVSKGLAYALMGERADDRIVNVQFHQSYSYEEFVKGYRPTTNRDQQLIFEPKDGAFLRLCERARVNAGQKFVMIIDEINRGNLSRVFGELLSLIEKDKRGDGFSVELLGGDKFSVPDNVYLLGTMNLADRSLAGMDYAMRRRFAFVTLEPQFGESVFEYWLGERQVPEGIIRRINDRMSQLNDVISNDMSLGRNFAVGHSFFCDFPVNPLLRTAIFEDDEWDGWYRNIVDTEIRPLLEEYWFDDLGKADDEVGKLLEGID